MDLALRVLIFAMLALGVGTPASADWADPSVSGISHSAPREIDGTSAKGILCCHPKTDHGACRLPGSHFKSKSQFSRVPESDPPPYAASPDYREHIGILEFEPCGAHALHLNFPDDQQSIYLTTLRLRL